MKCIRCHINRPAEEFHRDSRKKSGRRATCRFCINAQKRSGFSVIREDEILGEIEEAKKGKHYESAKELHEDISRSPDAQSNYPEIPDSFCHILSSLSKKHNSFINFTLNRDGKRCTLQIMGNPSISYRAESMEEMLKIISDNECL